MGADCFHGSDRIRGLQLEVSDGDPRTCLVRVVRRRWTESTTRCRRACSERAVSVPSVASSRTNRSSLLRSCNSSTSLVASSIDDSPRATVFGVFVSIVPSPSRRLHLRNPFHQLPDAAVDIMGWFDIPLLRRLAGQHHMGQAADLAPRIVQRDRDTRADSAGAEMPPLTAVVHLSSVQGGAHGRSWLAGNQHSSRRRARGSGASPAAKRLDVDAAVFY